MSREIHNKMYSRGWYIKQLVVPKKIQVCYMNISDYWRYGDRLNLACPFGAGFGSVLQLAVL